MPIAAVPAYLGKNFSTASPGLRFGMYLPIWTNRQDQEKEVKNRSEKKSREAQEIAYLLERQGMDAVIHEMQKLPRNPLAGLWEKNDFAAKQSWKQIVALTKDDKVRMSAIAARQNQLASISAHTLTLEAIATAPFTTGLGNEHPLENGFAFLNPYGLPYLPGSGIKGVLRQAARELASGEWGDTHDWTEEKIHQLEIPAGQPIDLSVLDVLFGLESDDGDKQHVRGALSFWDALPQIPGESLAVDIMTPHQSHYYQQKQERKSGDSTTPHDSGQPTPISFLTLPPGTGFAFHVQCDLPHLERLAPDLAENQRWQTLLTAAFEHAFAWLGFGAKTAVGYGAMEKDKKAEERRQREAQALREKAAQEAAQQQRQAELESMSPVDRAINECLDARLDKNMADIPALKNAIKAGQWQGDLKRDIALRLREMLQTANKWKEASTKKNPAKDNDYQDTLLVKAWISGQ